MFWKYIKRYVRSFLKNIFWLVALIALGVIATPLLIAMLGNSYEHYKMPALNTNLIESNKGLTYVVDINQTYNGKAGLNNNVDGHILNLTGEDITLLATSCEPLIDVHFGQTFDVKAEQTGLVAQSFGCETVYFAAVYGLKTGDRIKDPDGDQQLKFLSIDENLKVSAIPDPEPESKQVYTVLRYVVTPLLALFLYVIVIMEFTKV